MCYFTLQFENNSLQVVASIRNQTQISLPSIAHYFILLKIHSFPLHLRANKKASNLKKLKGVIKIRLCLCIPVFVVPHYVVSL